MHLSTRLESERKQRNCKLALKAAGMTKEVTIFDWSTVKELKEQISKILGIQESQQRVFLGHVELTNSRKLDDYNLFSSTSRQKDLYVQFNRQTGYYIKECPGCGNDAKSIISEANAGLNIGLDPKLALEGTGGTYFMKTAGQNIGAVFKPTDEEAYAPMNPKKYSGKLGEIGLRPGVFSGESAYREVAAYLLDESHFSAVPKTVLVQAQHPNFSYPIDKIYPKTGSLQEFIPNIGTVDDFSTSIFSTLEIQKICILDIRILNMDRNEGNILVCKNENHYKLVPIDHGLSISDTFEISNYDLCWMNWTQAKEPICTPCLEHIESLNLLKDMKTLQETMQFPDKCLRNLRIAGLLLKKSAKAGLSLYNIGTLLYRSGYSSNPSPVEKILENAYDLYKTINKSLSSRLKIEKYLSDCVKPVVRKRPRALSSNETDFEAFLPSTFSLNSTECTESDSLFESVVTISEVSEEEDFDDDYSNALDEVPTNQNSSFSSSGLPILDDFCEDICEDEAFNTKLFYYIEAFMDITIQKKVKELWSNFYLESEKSGGRIRSCSYALDW